MTDYKKIREEMHERFSKTFEKLHMSEKNDEITALTAEVKMLKDLVKEAYCEGFQDGRDGGWIVGPSIPWKSSFARAALQEPRT
jgi:hypothetical protein